MEYAIDELLEAAQEGDLSKLRNISRQPGIYDRVIKRATKYGHLHVIREHVRNEDLCMNFNYPGCTQTKTTTLLASMILRTAAKYGHIHILEYMTECVGDVLVGDMMKECDMGVQINATKFNQVKVMDWWLAKRRLTKNGELNKVTVGDMLINYAILCGSHQIVSFLLENGYTCIAETMPNKRVSKENDLKTMIVLHQWKLQGRYRAMCESGGCAVCNVEKTWDAWVMEHPDFGKVIQWLPREVMCDVLDLVLV